MIRARVDLRVPNQFMERHRITQGPIVEDFMSKFRVLVFVEGRGLRTPNNGMQNRMPRIILFELYFLDV